MGTPVTTPVVQTQFPPCSLIEPSSPVSVSQWSSRNQCHLSSTSAVFFCQGGRVNPAASQLPGLRARKLRAWAGLPIAAVCGGGWEMLPGSRLDVCPSLPLLTSGPGHTQAPPTGTRASSARALPHLPNTSDIREAHKQGHLPALRSRA